MECSTNRRGFIRLGILASVASLLPAPALAAARYFSPSRRFLSFYNTQTDESLERVYWVRGAYVRRALDEINHILRDHRTGEIKPIDPRLLDLLCAMHTKLRACSPFHIISGYRSPATNAYLREIGRGVAKDSLHMYGKAADIRLPGCDLSLLRQVAMDLKGGGVGYYPRSDFVHVDVGRVRFW